MKVAEQLKKARALAKSGQRAEAHEAYLDILARYPGNGAAMDALLKLSGGDARTRAVNEQFFRALASFKAGRLEDARDRAEALLSENPQSADIINLLAVTLGRMHRLDEALEVYRRGVAAAPGAMRLRQNYGKALIEAGQHEAGIAEYRHAAAQLPNDPAAQRRLAMALQLAGDIDGAREVVSAALVRHPEHVGLLDLSSMLRRYDSLADPEVVRMQRMLADTRRKPNERRTLAFALARACESAGDPERTVAALKTANALRRAELAYDPATDRALFASLKRHFDKPLAPLDVEPTPPMPIFITGMPRSGTTLVEQILASHPAVLGAGELSWWNRAAKPILRDQAPSDHPPVDRAGLAQLRDDYRAILASRAGGKPFVTDKMPTNFRWIGLIAAAFPEAPILHIRRDPRATCWSIYTKFFTGSGLGFAYDAADLAAYYRDYLELMAHWDAILPGRVTHVSYEALTEDQEGESRKLLAACGLDWDDAVLAFHETRRAVSTASAQQVRRKMYTGSSEAWRTYAPHLPELFEALPPASA